MFTNYSRFNSTLLKISECKNIQKVSIINRNIHIISENVTQTKQSARSAHPYHLVDGSPWPLLMSLAILGQAVTIGSWLTGFPQSLISLIPLALIALISILWWRDVIREAKGGYHTTIVQRGLLIGFLLFLLSEIMLFVSFFWAFFNSSLSPAVELGSSWPQ